MSDHDGELSVIVIPAGGSKPRSYSFSRRRLWLFGAFGTLAALATMVMAVSWVPLARRAALTDDLVRRVDSLTWHQTKMEHLAHRLARLEAVQDNYSLRLGVSGSPDSALWVPATRAAASGGEALSADNTATEPTLWPLAVTGVVTRPHLGGADADHPGIDIAVPSGSYVRAAGGGSSSRRRRIPPTASSCSSNTGTDCEPGTATRRTSFRTGGGPCAEARSSA